MTCSHRRDNCYPEAKPCTPRLWLTFGTGRGCVRTAWRGHGAGVLSPRKASPAKGRASDTFSSRRPSKRTCSRPGCAGAKPPPPRKVFAWMDVSSGAACATVHPASRAAMPDPTDPRANALPRVAGGPGRRQCAASACRREGLPWHGGGFAPPPAPSREQALSHSSATKAEGDPCTRQPCT